MGNTTSSKSNPSVQTVQLGIQHSTNRSRFSLGRPGESTHSLPLAQTKETTDSLNEKANFDSPRQVAYAPVAPTSHDDFAVAYQVFLKAFPEYQLTWILDTLRRTDFTRLDNNGETYVDFMGGSLYPESLIRVHTSFLNLNILGNTHSISNR